MSAAAKLRKLETILRAGMAEQAAGRLDAAERHYDEALALAPREPDVLHLKAQIRHLHGDQARGLDFVDKALRRAPAVAMYHSTRGVVLRAAGRIDEAAQAFATALHHDRRYAPAHHNLGALEAARGRYELALGALRQATLLGPGDAGAWCDLAASLLALNRDDEAVTAVRRAFTLAPRAASVIAVFVDAMVKAGRAGEAADEILRSNDPARDDDPERLAAIGRALRRAERIDDAKACLRRALALAPDHYGILLQVGDALGEGGDTDEAEAIFARAIALQPGAALAQLGLGNARRRRGDFVGALSAYGEAQRLDPNSADAWYNAGVVHSEADREPLAIGCYERALAIQPDLARAHVNRAMACFRLGRLREAWSDYRWRETGRIELCREIWPRDLAGRHVHLEPEQGIGDQLFYLRCARVARARGARVTSDPDPRLRAMLMRGGEEISKTGEGAQLRCRMADLPWLLDIAEADMFEPPIRMPALPARLDEVARTLETLPRPWIAVTWRAGGKAKTRDTVKEVDLEALAALLRPLAGTVISVQRQPGIAESAALGRLLGRSVIDFAAANEDLELMLALMASVDRYVGVSNTNVHLRLAVGLGSDVLVPHPIDWRWQIDASGTVPWYPACRAYHETGQHEWSPAFAALAAALQGPQS
jgi:tetratricopeptide (TPR) repeat protein